MIIYKENLYKTLLKILVLLPFFIGSNSSALITSTKGRYFLRQQVKKREEEIFEFIKKEGGESEEIDRAIDRLFDFLRLLPYSSKLRYRINTSSIGRRYRRMQEEKYSNSLSAALQRQCWVSFEK